MAVTALWPIPSATVLLVDPEWERVAMGIALALWGAVPLRSGIWMHLEARRLAATERGAEGATDNHAAMIDGATCLDEVKSFELFTFSRPSACLVTTCASYCGMALCAACGLGAFHGAARGPLEAQRFLALGLALVGVGWAAAWGRHVVDGLRKHEDEAGH
jgi:hypothetical protein